MNNRRLVIAGTGSGVGKTTVTIGLMAALMKRGKIVQGFKCGPDYIDPSYHTAVTKRTSRNLDSWMLGNETVLDIFSHASQDADISIMEGVMGFYDGKDPRTDVGSTADISVITNSPVLLVVNCASMARSAAAIVKGFQLLSDQPTIVGVLANRVGSQRHFEIVKTAIEQECNVPVIGYLKKEKGIEIPERSLGLIPSIERGELDPFFEQLGELVLETVDIDLLWEISQAEPLPLPKQSLFHQQKEAEVRIAVAKDAAFNSYYIENFELLESSGAELIPFSPLANEPVPPNCGGLYLGGSLPEEFVHTVSKSQRTKQSIAEAVRNGMPVFAEGGGFSLLSNAITTTDGERAEMTGVIPGEVTMHASLKAIGYREIEGLAESGLLPAGQLAKGHEFHHASFAASEPMEHAYETSGMRGKKADGYVKDNVLAGFVQFHFATCLPMVEKWIEQAAAYEKQSLTKH